jgi:calcium/calmodulin-dependent protein kinase I
MEARVLKESKWMGQSRSRWLVVTQEALLTYKSQEDAHSSSGRPTETFPLHLLKKPERVSETTIHLELTTAPEVLCFCFRSPRTHLRLEVPDIIPGRDAVANAILNAQLLQLTGEQRYRTPLPATEHHSFEDPMAVQLADRYAIGKELDRGAFGTVFEAACLQTGERVAIKVLNMPTADLRAKVREEVAVMRLVSGHENLNTLLNLFETISRTHLVLEFMAGGNLFDHIVHYFEVATDSDTNPILTSAEGGVDDYCEVHTQCIFSQLVCGVEALHSYEVAHRDLKPENVLLKQMRAGDAIVRIADFGLSLRLGSEPNGQTNERAGTLGYMAPQQLLGDMYGLEVDVWGLGILLFELLGGTHPFDTDVEQEKQDRAVCAGEWDFGHPNWSAVTDEAKDLVRRLIVVDPAKRASLKDIRAHPWMAEDDDDDDDDDESGAVGGSQSVHSDPLSTRSPLRGVAEEQSVSSTPTSSDKEVSSTIPHADSDSFTRRRTLHRQPTRTLSRNASSFGSTRRLSRVGSMSIRHSHASSGSGRESVSGRGSESGRRGSVHLAELEQHHLIGTIASLRKLARQRASASASVSINNDMDNDSPSSRHKGRWGVLREAVARFDETRVMLL